MPKAEPLGVAELVLGDLRRSTARSHDADRDSSLSLWRGHLEFRRAQHDDVCAVLLAEQHRHCAGEIGSSNRDYGAATRPSVRW